MVLFLSSVINDGGSTVILCVQTGASYFPAIGWVFMTMRWELQAKANVLFLSSLQFSFQGLTHKKIPACASIVKVRFYKSITQQSF